MTTRRLTILVVALALLVTPAVVVASDLFVDVLDDTFYHDPVEELFNARITIGCGVGIYCPNQSTTRGEMATFLARGLGRVAFQEGDAFVNVVATDASTATVITPVIFGLSEAAGGGGEAFVAVDGAFSIQAISDPATQVNVELRRGGDDESSEFATIVDLTPMNDIPATDHGSIVWATDIPTAGAFEFQLVAWRTPVAPNLTPGTVHVRGDIRVLYVPFESTQ